MSIDKRPTEPFVIWQKRMLFACKRGNIETELLLANYISELKQAPLSLRSRIETLLNETEQDLFHWLIRPVEEPKLSHHTCPPPNYLQLIAEIQKVYLK